MRGKVTATLAVAGLALAGCGTREAAESGARGQGTQEKTAFVRQVEATCVAHGKELQRIVRTLAAERSRMSQTALKTRLDKTMTALRARELAAFKKTHAPGDLKTTFVQWQGLIRQVYAAQLRPEESAAAEDRRRALSARISRLEGDLGFSKC